MPLAIRNNAIIVKDGRLAEGCSCCRECQTHTFPGYSLQDKGCGGGGVLHGVKTITIPSYYELPCTVTITGFVDDDLAIDGSIVQANQFVRPFFSACNPAHNVCYTFAASSRTFTIAAVDNYGINTSYNLTICFDALEGACCEGTSCSVKPQCHCQGAGKTFNGVGTACTTGACLCCNSDGSVKTGSNCAWCWCFCGDGAATYPRFINVSMLLDYKVKRSSDNAVRTDSTSATVTLAATGASGRTSCPSWEYGEIRSNTGGSLLALGAGVGAVRIESRQVSLASVVFDVLIDFYYSSTEADPFDRWCAGNACSGYSDSYPSAVTSSGPQSSAVCFSDIAGASFSKSMALGQTLGTFPLVPGQSNMQWSATITGMQP
jgi:hypothetical protein